jgi:hypothetical protein
MSVLYGFYQSVQSYFGTDFEEVQTTVHRPYRTDFVQSVQSFLAQKSRQVVVCFSGKFGTVFKEVVQPLMHPEIC